MSKTVFILGAGASKEGGAPCMNEFFDVARKLAETEPYVRKEHFRSVFAAIGNLQAVHSKAQLDIHNLESVFCAVEMGILLEKFPQTETENLRDLLKSLRIVIADTLEASLKFGSPSGDLEPPRGYSTLKNELQKLKDKGKLASDVTFLTLNYDYALETLLSSIGAEVDYCLGDVPHPNGVKVLKLHGSLSWFWCEECLKINSVNIDFLRLNWSHAQISQPGVALRLGLRKKGRKCDSCQKPLDDRFIVPPTWNKGPQYSPIANVWVSAAKELSTAERICVIGYSLPETDSFFRYLFALGCQGPAPIERFLVIDPSKEIKSRFHSLLGSGLKDRFEHHECGFRDSGDVFAGLLRT